MSNKGVPPDRVIIAIDPHKASWSAAAVGTSLQPLATIRVPVSPRGYRDLLFADGIGAVDVPAKLATRVRMLSTGHGRKNDAADAVSVAVAALTAAGLRAVAVDEAITALRALVEHREDVVKIRTQTANRLHVLLTQLLPAGAPRQLSAEIAAQLLRSVRPRTPGPRMLRRLAAELIVEIRHLDRRIAAATGDITAAVAAGNSTLTELCGIGDLTAGKILARVGDITRFPSAAAFASYTGTAPIEVSSGDVVRHRLSRAGDRQLNFCLHIMAITQIRRDTPGRAYYQRKRAAGKSHKEALRCLKRRLSDTVYRHLHREARARSATGPGGHTGASTESSATGSTPTAGSSDKSQPGPAGTEPTTHQPRST
jgi:transposase